jgi:Xaa-Pro aminopeptidase
MEMNMLQKLEEVQDYLRENQIDGWLLFDFKGMNPFVKKTLQLEGDFMLSRRWWVWIPLSGQPSVTTHAIEMGSFPDVGLPISSYSSRTDLTTKLQETLGTAKRVAMEFSPLGNNPYVSKVDAGSIDLIRSLGVEICSSGDVLQLFLAWTPIQLEHHQKANAVLTQTKDMALSLIKDRFSSGTSLSEFELQTLMCEFMESLGMTYDHGPIVGFGVHSNDPHYSPAATGSKLLEPGPILLDLWCKVPGENYYGDITWMAHLGTPSESFVEAFESIKESRDAGLNFLRAKLEAGQDVKGFEVDQVVRQVLIDAGYENALLHRTGHSLGTVTTHGDVAHFDCIETLDDRRILPNLGFTIEPGVYLPDFGVRSEINVYSTQNGLELTSAIQTTLDVL